MSFVESTNESSVDENLPQKRQNSQNIPQNSTLNKMSNMRIIQKNLVYVIGLSNQIAFKDVT